MEQEEKVLESEQEISVRGVTAPQTATYCDSGAPKNKRR